MSLLKPFIKSLRLAKKDFHQVSDVFTAYAYAVAYNYLIHNAYTEITSIDESQKANHVLRDLFIQHLKDNWEDHIDIQQGTIFKPEVAGTTRDLFNWQQAGYPMNRPASTYPYRLAVFQAIYNGTTVFFKTKKGKKREAKNIDSSGKTKTYSDVIQSRISNYTVDKVPYWMSFNYGTDHTGNHYYSRSGYPEYQGRFFIEDAEHALDSEYKPYVLNCVYDFYAGYLKGLHDASQKDAIDYIDNMHYPLGVVYVDVMSIVRKKT